MGTQEMIEQVLRKTGRDGIEDLIRYLADSDFYSCPASCENYRAEPGGLAQHLIDVYKILHRKYNEDSSLGKMLREDRDVTPSSLVVVAFLHDLFKIGKFEKYVKNQKVYDKKEVSKLRDSQYDIRKDEIGEYFWKSITKYGYNDDDPLKKGERSLVTALTYINLSEKEIRAIRYAGGCGDINTFLSAADGNPLLIALYESKLEAMIVEKTD